MARRAFLNMMEKIMVGKETAERDQQQVARATGATREEACSGLNPPEVITITVLYGMLPYYYYVVSK